MPRIAQLNNNVKHCRECNCELIIDTNWIEYRKVNHKYICNKCHSVRNKNDYIKNHTSYKPQKIRNQDKFCLTCDTKLTIGINWTEASKKRYDYHCRGCTNKKCKSINHIDPEKRKISRNKSQAKRRRKLNWIPMFGNPFTNSISVRWHHITDAYVVAIPKDLHELYGGYKTDKHRELVMNIVKQIYLEIDFK